MPSKKAPSRRPPRRAPPLKLADLPWRRIAWIIAVVAVIAVILYRSIDIDDVHAQADRLPAPVAFALLVFLPLLGMPVSVLHVAAGIRFGGPLGYGLVVLSIGLQLLASYALVHVWRGHFERSRWLARLRQRIPQGAHTSVCAFTVLLPGAPFAAVNYVLPLLGVPLRTLLLCAWPLHALRATITVALGDQSGNLTPARVSVLVAYALLIFGTSWWAYRRLQSQFSGPPRAAGGRKQPA